MIREVLYGRRKFSEMQKTLGVARNVLTNRLQRLVDEGILERRPYSEKPERYEYFLTEKGLDLWPTLVALMFWGDKHMPLPSGPPARLVHKGECGGAVNDRRICERCGKELRCGRPAPRSARSWSGSSRRPASPRLRTPACA